jgi:hypothetical protein
LKIIITEIELIKAGDENANVESAVDNILQHVVIQPENNINANNGNNDLQNINDINNEINTEEINMNSQNLSLI